MLRASAFVILAFALTLNAAGQVTSPSQSHPTPQESFASFSPDEQQQFQAAGKDFNAGHFTAALTAYKTLLTAHPGDPLLSKMTGEYMIDTGSAKQAITLLEPLEQQNPEDWQAAGLLARAYSETGDYKRRDAEFARLTGLYKQNVTPKGLTQYICEKVAVGDKQLIIFNSFVPWGNFKVYNYARVLARDGSLLSRITLESSDMDQILWAKDHPQQAAAGMRLFSLDGYTTGPANAAGQHTETHATYGFLDGQPTYDQVRTYFVNIASGRAPGSMAPNTVTIQPPSTSTH